MATNNSSATALKELQVYAFQGKYLEILHRFLKEVGIDPKNSSILTPFISVVEHTNGELLTFVINSDADVYGKTALHHASFEGSVDIVQYLVKKKFDLEAKNNDGNTPLMVAAEKSHKEVVEVLLNLGANIHCQSRMGWTVLHKVSYHGSVEMVQYFMDKGLVLDSKSCRGETPVMLAAGWAHTKVVQLLLNSGADVHGCDYDEWTVLHYACVAGDLSVVQILLKEGVNINAQTEDGKTPLHLAFKMSEFRIADYLLKAGADCNLVDEEGFSSFSYLIKVMLNQRQIEGIKKCIEWGAYVKPIDNPKLCNPFLRKIFLLDAKLCSQAVINRFNNKDLPTLYKKLSTSQRLPLIDQMKIGSKSEVAQHVERTVTNEIEVKGYCDLLNFVPPVLSMLCVKSYLEVPKPALNQGHRYNLRSRVKRSLCNSKQEDPCKKLCHKKL